MQKKGLCRSDFSIPSRKDRLIAEMGNSGIVDEDINALADFFYFAKYAADNVGIAYIAGESCAAAAGSKNFMFGFSPLFD